MKQRFVNEVIAKIFVMMGLMLVVIFLFLTLELRGHKAEAASRYVSIEVEFGKEYDLKIPEGGDYLVTIAPSESGGAYIILVKQPAHEELIQNIDLNNFEMAQTLQIGLIFIQRQGSRYFIRYPQKWVLDDS